MLMNNLDPYFKKIIRYDYRDHSLQFKVSQTLFSSHDIDFGTQRLLRSLTLKKFNVFNKVLDFGCGYGSIGIALKSVYPAAVVHMADRDALAIDYSHQNAELNNMSDIKVYKSLGYDDVTDTDFDLIVSNIPAKVGEPVLSHILQDARFYLRPGGHVAVVVTDTIENFVAKVLLKDFSINVLFQKKWPGHSVFHYEFSPKVASLPKPKLSTFERGIYDRGKKIISLGNTDVSIQTVYGLPEFDTLSYETEMLLKSLHMLRERNINTAVLFNSGQGYVPVALSLLAKVKKIALVDRDLLALKISKRNLIFNDYSSDKILLLHQIDLQQEGNNQVEVILGVFDEKDGPLIHAMYIKQAAVQLSPNGLMILVSSSTAITRIEKIVKADKFLDVLERRRSKGKSLIIIKRKS